MLVQKAIDIFLRACGTVHNYSLLAQSSAQASTAIHEILVEGAKSLYRSRAGGRFYGTENYIWAGFGPIGNTEEKNWDDYQQLLRKKFCRYS